MIGVRSIISNLYVMLSKIIKHYSDDETCKDEVCHYYA